MKIETPSNPPPDPQSTEKQPWTPPNLKKMDIEETAISVGQNFDGDGMS
jgi:hypothetical protein